MAILESREKKLCAAESSRPRTKFLSSHFYTRLFDCEASYESVAPSIVRWLTQPRSRDDSCPDPLDYYSKWIVPVNIGNYHWALMVVRFQEQKIEFYDSIPNPSEASRRMKNMLRFIGDVAKATRRTDLADVAQPGTGWVCSLVESPSQDLDYDDCGIFAILNSLIEMSGQRITRNSYRHQDIYDLDIRSRIACEILSSV